MRLFDKVLTQCPGEDADMVRASASKVTVLACDEIAKYYADSSEMHWTSDKYPHAKPPFDAFFIEWNEPQQYRIGNDVLLRDDGVKQVGFFVVHITEPEAIRQSVSYHFQGDVSRLVNRSYSAVDVESARSDTASIIYASPFVVASGRCGKFPVNLIAFLSPDGWVHYRVLPTEEGTRFRPGLEEEQAARFVSQAGHVMFLAFTFLNCSNVKLEDVTADLEPPPKIKRRLRIPDVKRYTLNINGHFSKPRRELGEPGEKDVMPFHLCRGHFATYTNAAPLFGKYTGRFWIPPHTKGKKENGVIEKDYAIVN